MTARPPLSRSSSTCSVNSTNSDWMPTGVYVPVHKRAQSDTSSLVSDSVSDGEMISISSSFSNTCSEVKSSSPHARIYSRNALLALAPTSLISAVLRPVVSRSLVAAHPACLRMRGDGVARALCFARADADADAADALQMPCVAEHQTQVQAPARRTRGRRGRRRTTTGGAENVGGRESTDSGEVNGRGGRVKAKVGIRRNAVRPEQSALKSPVEKSGISVFRTTTTASPSDGLTSWRTLSALAITV